MKEIEININMRCSVCGNDQFSVIDESIEDLISAPDEAEIKCFDCGRITTKEQIVQENSHIIDANIEDLKDEVIRQLKKDLKNFFK